MRDDSSYMLDGRAAAHNILAVPIMTQEEVTRWLIVRKPSDYDELDQELLEALASYMAIKRTAKSQ